MKAEGPTWDIAGATATERDDDGHPLVQMDAYRDVGGSPFTIQHPYGFFSRPRDPDDGGFCSLLVYKDGSTRLGWLGYDPRYLQQIPLLKKGGSCMYIAFPLGGEIASSFALLDGDDGTFQVRIPTEAGDHEMTIGVDGANRPTVSLRHANGAVVEIVDSIVLKSQNGGVYVEVSDSGIVLKGPITMQGGVSPPGGVPLVSFPGLSTHSGAIQALLAALVATVEAQAALGDAAAIAAAPALPPLLAAVLGTLPATQTTVTKGL